MAALRRLLMSSAVISAGSTGTAVLSLLQSAVIARLLGLTDFGLWTLLTALFSTVVALAGFRIAEPLTKYIVEFKSRGDREGLRQLFGAAALTEFSTLSVACALGIAVAALLGGAYLGAGAKALFVYALSLPPAALNPVLFAVARDARRLWVPTLLTLGIESLRLLLLLGMQPAGMSSIGTVASIWLVTAVLQFGLSALLLQQLLRQNLGIALRELRPWGASRSRLRGFWDFMRRNFAASSISAALKNGDLLLLGAVQTPDAVGIFRVAKSISALLQMVSGPIGSAFYQDMNEFLIKGDRAGAWRLIKRATLTVAPVILLAALFTGMFASDIIAIIYGDAFRPGGALLVVLLLSSVVMALLFWAHPTLLALGRTSFYLWSLMVVTTVSLPAYWLCARAGLPPFAWAVTGAWTALFSLLALRAWYELARGKR